MVDLRRFASALVLLSLPALALPAGKKKATSGAAAEYSVVGGTVFRDTGFAMPDVEVTLEMTPAPPKAKKLKATSSPQGEFSFRVPPAAAKYKVSVAAKGFQPADKIVEIQGPSERVDATFTMLPESKY